MKTNQEIKDNLLFIIKMCAVVLLLCAMRVKANDSVYVKDSLLTQTAVYNTENTVAFFVNSNLYRKDIYWKNTHMSGKGVLIGDNLRAITDRVISSQDTVYGKLLKFQYTFHENGGVDDSLVLYDHSAEPKRLNAFALTFVYPTSYVVRRPQAVVLTKPRGVYDISGRVVLSRSHAALLRY